MWGLNKMKLTDVCDFQGGSQPPKEEWSYKKQDGFIRMLQIRDFTQSEKVTPEYIKLRNNTKICEADDILIARYGASIGKILTGLAGAYNVAIMRTIPDETILKKRYLYYYLKSSYFQNNILNVGSRAAQAGFNKEDLSKLSIHCPKIEEQDDIADILEKVEKIIAERERELKLLEEFIKARFVELFIGKNYPLVALDDLSLGKGEYGAQSASIEYDNDRPRYVRITDINDDGTLNDDIVSSANVEDDEQYKLSYGDFLFARMGATVGKTYFYKTGNQIFAGYLIRYKLNLEKVMPEYLYSYTKLDEYKTWVMLNQSGAAQPGINAKKYGSLQIPVPPIDLQNEFAAFVAQIDKSKVAVQKALDEAQLLFDSLMQQYFG